MLQGRLTNDGLTPEQREIRDLVRTLARERIAPRAAEIDKSAEFPWDVVELFRENGIFGTLADEEYGGVGASALATLVSVEEISKVCATSGLILAVQELGALGFKLAGPRSRSGGSCRRSRPARRSAAYALTEPGLGLRRGAMRTEARRDGDGYVLDGSKRFITNAGSPGCTSSSRRPTRPRATPGSRRSRSRRGAPGLEIGRIEPKMGIKGSTTGEVFLTGCRVPAANRLGEEGEGWRIAMRILDRSRPGIAAQALGIAEGATDYALEYARTRETMGEPIANHQLVAGMLADMETQCEAARGLLYRCGALIDSGADGPELTKLSAITKLFCSDTAMAGDDRRGAGARRIRVHAGVPGRADDAGREDHPDLRGHEPDPAARDRARDGPRGPRHSVLVRVKLSSARPRPLPGRRDHEGRPVRLLRGGRAGDPAAPARPAVHDEALARGARGRSVLPEAGAEGDARLDPDAAVPDVAARGRVAARRLPARQLGATRSSGWCRCTAST